MAMHQEGARSGEPASSGINGRVVLAVVLAVVVVVFVLQNRDDVDLDFLMLGFSAPLWIVLACTTLVGVGIGLLLGRRQVKRKARRKA